MVSTGLSSAFVVDWVRKQGARSVELCSLFDRPQARLIDISVHFVGFEAPIERMAGFGIGIDPELSELPFVIAVS